MTYIVAILAFALLTAAMVHLATRPARLRRSRVEVMARPFPAEWRRTLMNRMAWYPRLPGELREKIHGCVQILAAEKSFEACGGLEEVTDEMVVLITAQASLLLIGRDDHDYFPLLRSILVYPGAYTDPGHRVFDLRRDREAHRLGESWTTGSIVLAWDEVLRGSAGSHDGTNLVLHEFAHQLDQADGTSDGAPVLEDADDYADWSRVFQDRYEELIDDVNAGSNTLLDDYGAESPAEFFAVATETFFERPKRMNREAPDLYAELRDFYGLDPAAW